MADHEHVQHHVKKAREACLDMRSAIIDLLPGNADEFVRSSLLDELDKVQRELRYLSYSAVPWTT